MVWAKLKVLSGGKVDELWGAKVIFTEAAIRDWRVLRFGSVSGVIAAAGLEVVIAIEHIEIIIKAKTRMLLNILR
jgi:hypothetical protein